ncbi:MAG: alanine racemase, partial [Hyphomonadaceae bacterium]|nr:alanine racemase [Hyphomonadaceae bacterium]
MAARQTLGGDGIIYVLNGLMTGQSAVFHTHNLRPVLNDLDQIACWRETGLGAPAGVHIDTGMNRLGLSEDEVDAAQEDLSHVNLALIMSHLACASDPNHPKNHMQRDAFIALSSRLPPAPLSLSASAGTLLGSDYSFDLTRPGIGLYGGGPFDRDHVPLQP